MDGPVLLSAIVATRRAPTCFALGSNQDLEQSGARLSLDRRAIDASNGGGSLPSLPDQLAQLQRHYRRETGAPGPAAAGAPAAATAVSDADAVNESPLLHIQLGSPTPEDEVLAYYEGDASSPAAAESVPVSLFSCSELVYLTDLPAPPTPRSSSANASTHALSTRWRNMFRAPLTVFDDRYGGNDFWVFLRQILYKGAFGFEAVDGERYVIQLQGLVVPVIECDEYEEEEGGVYELSGSPGSSRPTTPADAHSVTSFSLSRTCATTDGSRAYDLFHFFAEPSPTEQALSRGGSPPSPGLRLSLSHESGMSGGKRAAAKCVITSAEHMEDVLRRVENFYEMVEDRQGPVHTILYITFLDSNDPSRRHSLSLVRLDDVSLKEQLTPEEFRVAGVLETLAEELALALVAGAETGAVFDDAGVQDALSSCRLTFTLRRLLRRNYECFVRRLRGYGDGAAMLHWLFNLPEGTVAEAESPVARVSYSGGSTGRRLNHAMELLVRFQMINEEGARIRREWAAAMASAPADMDSAPVPGATWRPAERSRTGPSPHGEEDTGQTTRSGHSCTRTRARHPRRRRPKAPRFAEAIPSVQDLAPRKERSRAKPEPISGMRGRFPSTSPDARYKRPESPLFASS